MKFFFKAKDGGPESNVTGYWLCEGKNSFSIALLVFENGSREVFHSHAFDCWSLVLKGMLCEHHLDGRAQLHSPGAFIETFRETFHKVYSIGRTYVLTVRGPWADKWHEAVDPFTVWDLTHGRKRVEA